MKKILFSLIVLCGVVVTSCNNKPDAPVTPIPEPTPEPTEFVIDVDEDQLTAYQVVFSVYPEDKTQLYYCDVMSKERWAQTYLPDLVKEVDDSLKSFAQMTESTYEEVAEQMLNKGDCVDFCSNAGYRGNTDFVVYAFYWDPSNTDVNVTIAEFSTPSPVESQQSVNISFDNVEATTMSVTCQPTESVKEYYYFFDETTKVESMLAGLEDDNAFLSYHAMNIGVKKTAEATMNQTGLKAETEYTAIVMLIDNDGNRRQVSATQTTAKVEQGGRIESELFETLLGEWSGTQTISDGYSEPMTHSFTVTIASSVDGYDYNYRDHNQVVALVDGWCSIPYYSIDGLLADEIEDPEEKFGTKWAINIAEDDVLSIDGRARTSVIGWLFMGHCFMVSGSSEQMAVNIDNDMVVTLSDDGNTLTISSPLAGYYPSLAYDFQGFGWMAYFYGTTDIVLTRN